MNNLHLPNPKMMDVAVPANRHIGKPQHRDDAEGFAIPAREAHLFIARGGVLVVDLREASERARRRSIGEAVHSPYGSLPDALAPGGLLNSLARATGKRLVFFCAYGERSAMAVEAARAAGFADACHIEGGLDAWIKAAPSP
jgi:sulfur dioxygenase